MDVNNVQFRILQKVAMQMSVGLACSSLAKDQGRIVSLSLEGPKVAVKPNTYSASFPHLGKEKPRADDV